MQDPKLMPVFTNFYEKDRFKDYGAHPSSSDRGARGVGRSREL
jgi:hypothetical protein